MLAQRVMRQHVKRRALLTLDAEAVPELDVSLEVKDLALAAVGNNIVIV